jgi:hypothetical protein
MADPTLPAAGAFHESPSVPVDWGMVTNWFCVAAGAAEGVVELCMTGSGSPG